MSIIVPSRSHFREAVSPFDRALFCSPEPAGRKIIAGFTYLQRISKAASYDVWFPDRLKYALDARAATGEPIGPVQFPAQWAAVRQFELLQEAGNNKIYDLDPSNLQRAMIDLSGDMRAGGYRVTVATIGTYRETSVGDELEILDRRLQRRIAQIIHMLYLSEQSDQANSEMDSWLATEKWNYREALPHVGMVLGADNLFRPPADDDDCQKNRDGKAGKKSGSSAISAASRKHKRSKQFFNILNELPQKHIVHDTAIGLQLPELNGNNEWNYIASPDETLSAFNLVLNDLFDPFNHLSLSRLNGHENAHAEIKPSTYHMRSYGHPLTENAGRFYRSASHALN